MEFKNIERATKSETRDRNRELNGRTREDSLGRARAGGVLVLVTCVGDF